MDPREISFKGSVASGVHGHFYISHVLTASKSTAEQMHGRLCAYSAASLLDWFPELDTVHGSRALACRMDCFEI